MIKIEFEVTYMLPNPAGTIIVVKGTAKPKKLSFQKPQKLSFEVKEDLTGILNLKDRVSVITDPVTLKITMSYKKVLYPMFNIEVAR
jgi:hypothetical protein